MIPGQVINHMGEEKLKPYTSYQSPKTYIPNELNIQMGSTGLFEEDTEPLFKSWGKVTKPFLPSHETQIRHETQTDQTDV